MSLKNIFEQHFYKLPHVTLFREGGIYSNTRSLRQHFTGVFIDVIYS